MVDNVELNPGSGGVDLATDEIGGVHHQRVKVQIGANNSASDVHGGNPLPISGSVGISGSLPAGTNNIGDVDIASSLPAGSNTIGGVNVASALPAGANLIGDVGLAGTRTAGGVAQLYKNIDVDESEDQVKGTAGQIYWLHVMNLSGATLYLKIYNATAANVTVGTTVPDLTFPIPTQGDTNGAGFVMAVPNGIEFKTAITIAATTGLADNDAGAPGNNEVVVNLGYA